MIRTNFKNPVAESYLTDLPQTSEKPSDMTCLLLILPHPDSVNDLAFVDKEGLGSCISVLLHRILDLLIISDSAKDTPT